MHTSCIWNCVKFLNEGSSCLPIQNFTDNLSTMQRISEVGQINNARSKLSSFRAHCYNLAYLPNNSNKIQTRKEMLSCLTKLQPRCSWLNKRLREICDIANHSNLKLKNFNVWHNILIYVCNVLITKSISHQLDNSDAILTASSFKTSKYM